MRLVKNPQTYKEGATVAQVSFSSSGQFGAVGAAEYRGVPVFAPRGMAYQPCEGDNLLILPVDGVDTCVGVLSRGDGLRAGEMSLASSGGATLILKNNGDVCINGLTITKDGALRRLEEEGADGYPAV